MRGLQRKIHMGCRALGLDNEARRNLQLEVTGKTSMTDMTQSDMLRVISRLEADGFAPDKKGGKKHAPAPRADLRLVHVLWRKLGDAGALDRPTRAGLNAFIRAQFGEVWQSVPADVDMLRDAKQIEAVVAALKAWGKRANIDFDFKRGRG